MAKGITIFWAYDTFEYKNCSSIKNATPTFTLKRPKSVLDYRNIPQILIFVSEFSLQNQYRYFFLNSSFVAGTINMCGSLAQEIVGLFILLLSVLAWWKWLLVNIFLNFTGLLVPYANINLIVLYLVVQKLDIT